MEKKQKQITPQVTSKWMLQVLLFLFIQCIYLCVYMVWGPAVNIDPRVLLANKHLSPEDQLIVYGTPLLLCFLHSLGR